MNHSLTDLGFNHAGHDAERLDRMATHLEKNLEPPLVLSPRLVEASGSHSGTSSLSGNARRGPRMGTVKVQWAFQFLGGLAILSSLSFSEGVGTVVHGEGIARQRQQ